MIRITGARNSGKTIKLLDIAQKNGYVIVEPTARMADCVKHIAAEKEFNVKVISVHELLSGQYKIDNEKYLVDELDMFLDSLGIAGYSNTTYNLTRF